MESSRDNLEHAYEAGRKEGAARSIAYVYCLVVGLGLVAVGVLGFIFGGSGFGSATNVQGEEFAGLEVNGWHNVVHIATGALLLLLLARPALAASGALVFGIVYAGVAVWGFLDGNDLGNIIPVNTADNWLHAALAATAIVAGVMSGALGVAGRREAKRAGLRSVPREHRPPSPR